MESVTVEQTALSSLVATPDIIQRIVAAIGEDLGKTFDERGGQLPEGTLYSNIFEFVGRGTLTPRNIVRSMWAFPDDDLSGIPHDTVVAMALGITAATLMQTDPAIIRAILSAEVGKHSRLLQERASTSTALMIEPNARGVA